MFPFTRSLLTLCLLAVVAVPAIGQDHEGGHMPAMGAPEQMSEFASMVGDWDVVMKYRMTPADAWTTSKGSSSIQMTMNGCVLEENMKFEMMGMTIHGLQHLTFNRETGEYNSVWVDDMSGKMTITAGKFEDGKLVMMGDDRQGGMAFKMRNTSHYPDDDTIEFTMEMSVDGGENWVDSMEITYARAK